MPAPVSFIVPDPFKPDSPDGIEQHLRQLATGIRGAMDGKINAAFDFNLAVSPAVQTTVSNERIRSTSRILMHPVNEHAAGDWASGTVEIRTGDVTDGAFLVRHVPTTLTRSFRVSILS